MKLELKNYQRDCLDRLSAYLKRARELGAPKTAFYEATNRTTSSLH